MGSKAGKMPCYYIDKKEPLKCQEQPLNQAPWLLRPGAMYLKERKCVHAEDP